MNFKLLELSDDEFGNVQRKMEGVPYKAMVESLVYAMVGTRDDLAVALSMVSQFISHAIASHSMVVKRIMRYLKDMLDFKTCLGDNDIALREFYGMDWAGDANDQRSTTGYMFLVGVGVILWKCKKPPTIALSTMKAETIGTLLS